MQSFRNPEEAIDSMDFYGAMLVADFGSGIGYFALPIAKKIAKEGVVYAFDIQEAPLEILRKKASSSHLYNIQTMRADLERAGGSSLMQESIDRVVIANILFQATQKQQILQEAVRILKKSGKIIIVEWDTAIVQFFGPRGEARLSKEQIKNLLTPMGCALEKEFSIGDHHSGYVYIKKQ
ncbi:MAG: class I SAM-dependent methyltransferase [Patescibacteria group bacterium]